jgi:hypothetical protein
MGAPLGNKNAAGRRGGRKSVATVKKATSVFTLRKNGTMRGWYKWSGSKSKLMTENYKGGHPLPMRRKNPAYAHLKTKVRRSKFKR